MSPTKGLAPGAIGQFKDYLQWHPGALVAIHAIEDAFEEYDDPNMENFGLCIVGRSGVGKTRLIDYVIENTYAEHTEERSNYPVIKIDLKSGALVKSVELAILKELGITDVKYSPERTVELVYKQIKACGLKVVFVDEFQHLVRKNKKDINANSADWFKNLIKNTDVIVVLVGTEAGTVLLDMDRQLRDRLSPPINISPMQADCDDSFVYFCDFLRRLMENFPLKTVSLSDPYNAARMLMASEGSLRILNRLLVRVLKTNAGNAQRKLTMKDYAAAYKHIYRDKKFLGSRGQWIHPFRSSDKQIHSELAYILNAYSK